MGLISHRGHRIVAGVALAVAVSLGAVVPTSAAPDAGMSDAAPLELGSADIELAFESPPPAPNVTGGCEAISIFPSAPCTLFSSVIQVPDGSFTIEQIGLRTGPRTGQMRIDIVEAVRSQLPGPNGLPSPAACCFQRASSPVFTPAPNTLNIIDLDLPVRSEVMDLNGEPVEFFQYVALTLLDFDSSLPILARSDLPILGQLGPVVNADGLRNQAATFFSAIPTMSIIACNDDGSSEEDICQQVGSPGESLTGINPTRLLDTRESGGRVAAGSTTRVQVASAPGVPDGAVGAVLNVTAVNPAARGFLTVFPCDERQPTASNLNYLPGQNVANAVVATFGSSGEVCVFNSTSTNLVVDLNGALTAGFAGRSPDRLLDTRESGGRVAAGSTTRVQVASAPGVPDGAVGAVLNVTAVNPAARGFLTVFPCDERQPTASNLNYLPGQNVANAVVATFGSSGEVCVFNSTSTNLVVDLNGALTAGFAGRSPDRLLDTRESGGRVAAGSTTRVQVASAPGVPDGAVGAVLNVTAVNPAARGFLTVFPCDERQPTASNLNYLPGQNVANAVVATFGSSGEVCVFNSTSTNLVVDLNGAFT